MTAMPLHTERLRLVPSTPEEVRAQIARMDARDKAELSAAWLALLDAATTIDPWVLGFSIVLAATGDVIGSCGFKGPPDSDGMVEIAYGTSAFPSKQRICDGSGRGTGPLRVRQRPGPRGARPYF